MTKAAIQALRNECRRQMAKTAAASVLANYPRDTQRAILQRAREMLLKDQQGNILLKSLGLGTAAGAIGAGTFGLAKQMSRAISPPRITYTLPTEFGVYEPEAKKKPKVAADPGYSLFRSPMSSLVAKDPAMSSQVWLALAAGVPLGFLTGIKATKSLSRVARSKELDMAKADFERALQETAGVAEPDQTTKVASSPIAKLADNCQQLSKIALAPADLKKMLYIYLGAAPAIGAYYGFQQQWDKRKARQLEAAERLSNVNREESNPTFATADLVSLKPHVGKKSDRAQAVQKLQTMLDQSEHQPYPYL